MTTQETALYTLASTGVAVFGVLTFIYNSPFFSVPFGGIVTATIGYFVQSRVWKRTVRRENALKHNDVIYTPLYKEIGTILDRCGSFSFESGYSELSFPEWNRIRSEPNYRFIDQPLRGELDSFYVVVDVFNSNQQKLGQKTPSLVLEQFAKKFELPAYSVSYVSKSAKQEVSETYLNNTIVFGVHPTEVLKRQFPNRDDLKFYPRFKITYPSGTAAIIDMTNPEDIKRFDDFYWELSKKIMNYEEARNLKKALDEIVGKAPELRESLFKVIEKTSS